MPECEPLPCTPVLMSSWPDSPPSVAIETTSDYETRDLFIQTNINTNETVHHVYKSATQTLQGPNHISGATKTSKRDSSRPTGPLNSFNYKKPS